MRARHIDAQVHMPAQADGGRLESRLTRIKGRRRRTRARLVARELGWLVLIGALTALVITQLGSLARG